MSSITRVGLVAVLSAALFACSSNETGSTSGGSSGAPPGTTSGGTPSDGTSGAPATSATTPATPAVPAGAVAPTLDKVEQMQNVLHVMWTNPASKCDTIEGQRKADMPDGTSMEKYKVVFSVGGDVDNKMDTSATDAMKYTYRVRCKVGATYSAFSGELSGTPRTP